MSGPSSMRTGAIWPFAFLGPGIVLVFAVRAPEFTEGVVAAVVSVGAITFAAAGKTWTDVRIGAGPRSYIAGACWMAAFVIGGLATLLPLLGSNAPVLRFFAGGVVTGSIGWVTQAVIEKTSVAAAARGLLVAPAGFGLAFVLYLLGAYFFAGMLGDFVPASDVLAAAIAATTAGMLARGSLDGAARLARGSASRARSDLRASARRH